MSGPVDVPVQKEEDGALRLAKALGVSAQRVEAASAAAGISPSDAFSAIVHGTDEARVGKLAKELHVGRPRLALALLDAAVSLGQGAASSSGGPGAVGAAWAGASGAQSLGERVAQQAKTTMSRATEWLLDVAEFVLETFAETVPRILGRITLVIALTGLTLLGLGILAFVDRGLFLQVAFYAMATALVVYGAGFLWMAWRIHEATASLRTIARIAKKWRSRLADRRE